MLQTIQSLEAGALLAIQSLRTPVLDAFMQVYTTLGDMGLIWLVLSIAMVCYRPTRRAGVVAIGAVALGALCTNVVLKHLVGRVRPFVEVVGLIPLVAEHDPNSFPSGHTCAAFAAGMSWFWALPKKWMGVAAVALAVGMGLSRLYVGVHYPSDVLAGAVVGTLCAVVVGKLYAKQYGGLANRRH